MRARLLLASCAILATACGSKPDRAARIDAALRNLCGERYQPTWGCESGLPAPSGISAGLDLERKTLTVFIRGDEASLPAYVKTLTAEFAPFLDAEQERVVAAELPMLVPSRFRPFERIVHGVAISAATWTGDLPWDRVARLTLTFDPPKGDEPKPPMATVLKSMGGHFGWSDAFGAVDEEQVAKWKILCADGEWAAGDVWARCRRAELTWWAEWTPRTRRLLRANLETPGDLARAVDTLALPLLTDEQRAEVQEALTAPVDSLSKSGDFTIRSEHGADRHTIAITAL